MPWTAEDVEKHRQGLTHKHKKRWAYIANAAYEACKLAKLSDADAEEKAIKIANSKFDDQRFNPLFRKQMGFDPKKYQYTKKSPPDPTDGHTHTAAYDEDGNGGTSIDGNPPHAHQIYGFKVMSTYAYEPSTNTGYTSNHPGSIAFGELRDINEMEIFRVGVHNGDSYTEADLEEIAFNFDALKDELRPKLKITHLEDGEQESLAGLASYGDVVSVYTKKGGDGKKRLYARLARVPLEVHDWIKDGRFAERSIEIYPEFKLGTKEDSPVYKNVLKSIALLGHQMPAVTGMEAIKLEECLECQGTQCVRQPLKFEEKKEDAVPAELELASKILGQSLELTGKV